MTSYADQQIWLNLTNIALGLLCVALMATVVAAVAYDVVARRRERRRRRSLWCVLKNDRAREATPRRPVAG